MAAAGSKGETGLRLETASLAKSYGDFPAVQGVSVRVCAGDFLALLGRNGAGKTTLLKMLALVERPTSGRLMADGQEADEDPTALRRRIGYLGHNTFLYDELTARENLGFYGELYGVSNSPERRRMLLEAVELAPFADQMVRHYSRGMKQRLAIARLFLHEPDVLLLDEPFTGLDDRAALLLEEMLRDAHGQGKTIVLCTHELDRAVRLAQVWLILEKGKVTYYGPNEAERPERMRELYRRCAGGKSQ
jgi:heme exporter protein A